MSQRIHLVAAARPNFMKIAPLYHAMREHELFEVEIVHTGQHYDANMSDRFFEDLRLPSPDYHLGVGSGSHATQTGRVLIEYERLLVAHRPDATIVVGDVNSTIACALAAKKLGVTVAHLEAGLRSRDRTMPEELNRILTDAIADILWTPSPDADANLHAEGIPGERITRVGNIMLDSFELLRDRVEAAVAGRSLGREPGGYAVVTLHRPVNVDERESLAPIVAALASVSEHIPLVFPVHPRTLAALERNDLLGDLERLDGVELTAPLGYVEFMARVVGARLVITDSGGLQEETTYLQVPCLTLRENTERPITITQGTNQLVRAENLVDHVTALLGERQPRGTRPDLWDGRTADRVRADLERRLR